MKNDSNTNISELKELAKEFRDERDWGQFHNIKDLAIDISVEAGELLELFLWHKPEDFKKQMEEDLEFKEDVSDELADAVSGCLAFANVSGIDISTVYKNKKEIPNRKGKRQGGKIY